MASHRCSYYGGCELQLLGSLTLSTRGVLVTEQLDVDLNDAVLRAEILLVADLMVAGSQSAGHLSQADVDQLLSTGFLAQSARRNAPQG
jgi:hypothetical protein